MIICHFYSPEEAFEPFKQKSFVPFRDAGDEPSDFECSLFDCLKGLDKAISYNWYNYRTFDYKEYENMHRLDNGDMNWIIPGKILALSSPTAARKDGLPPDHFVEPFLDMGIKCIIKLNESLYS